MQRRVDRAFTLVEILVVVVILGILAAIVIPQFTSASQEAVKSAVQSQMKTFAIQMSVYRARNRGLFPLVGGLAGTDPTFPAVNNGWGVLVSLDYLKRSPVNPYTNTTDLVDAPGASPNMAAGNPVMGISSAWGYRPQDLSVTPPLTVKIFARGYDPTSNLLSNEAGYTQVIP